MSSETLELTDFQSRYLDTVRGWSNLVVAERPDEGPIVDIDVAPATAGRPTEYDDFDAVRVDLEELAASVPADEPDRAVVEKTIESHITLLRADQGEQFEFEDYVEGTLGFRPEPVSPDEIAASSQLVDDLFREAGLGHSREYTDRFLADHVVRDEQKIRAGVAAALRFARGAAADFIDEAPELTIQPEYSEEDSYGVSSITMGPDGEPKWDVNLFGDRHRLDIGRINTLTAHEVAGHVLHLALLERNIKDGAINPVLGAATVHSPFAFQAEALAQNAEFEFTDDTWDSTHRAIYNHHLTTVFYDVLWRANHGEDPVAIADGIDREGIMPFEPKEFYKPEFITAMRDNPVMRAYLPAYYPSIRAMRDLQAGMGTDQRRQTLNQLYNTAFLPQELIALSLPQSSTV